MDNPSEMERTESEMLVCRSGEWSYSEAVMNDHQKTCEEHLVLTWARQYAYPAITAVDDPDCMICIRRKDGKHQKDCPIGQALAAAPECVKEQP